MDVADHRKTLSHGHLGKKAREYRAMHFDEIDNGNMDKVFQIEYDFIKSEFPSKYDVALEEMIDEAIKGRWITKRPSGSSPINAEGVQNHGF